MKAKEEPGFDARRRLAELGAQVAVIPVMRRLLRNAAERLDELERGPAPAARITEQAAAKFLPIAEAAARSGMSARSLKRLIERGALDGCAVKVSGSRRRRWLVNSNSLSAFLGLPVHSRRESERMPARHGKVTT
jgi:hypothetical protein